MYLYVLLLKLLVFLLIEKLKKKIFKLQWFFYRKRIFASQFFLDHRNIDAVLSSKIVKEGKRLLDNPQSFSYIKKKILMRKVLNFFTNNNEYF